MNRLLPLIAAVLALCLLAAPACASEFEVVEELEDGYVFGYEPDYEYISSGLYIGIKRVEENNITYFVADIRADSAERLKTAKAAWFDGKENGAKSERVSEIAARHEAVLAINADNFKNHSYGLIVRNGEVLRTKPTSWHVMMIAENGDMLQYSGVTNTEEMLQVIEARGVSECFTFGPVLVRDGKAVPLPNGEDFKLIAMRDSILEPRTAIGQLDTLRYIVIVVDGRREGYSEGVNMHDLQALFVRYGAQQAFNLDGGGSTTLYFNGEVINRPSGGNERKVTDILYFK